jgi:RHS repeat-associated protein
MGWGPNGHPITYNSNSIAYTLHWDGDALLFITNAAGTIVDFKVGMYGDIVPADTNYALTIFDRDFGGAVASEHNSTGFNVWEPLNPSYGGSGVLDPAEVNGSTGFKVGACLLCQWRTDGYEAIAGVGQFGVDPLTIQGVRAYDGSAGTWTSPDAYAGDVSDPISLQSYMWNGNNPIAFSDPSGFCSCTGGSPGFDTQQFADTLDTNAAARSTCYCGLFVGNALGAGGASAGIHNGVDYGQSLHSAGWDFPGSTPLRLEGAIDTAAWFSYIPQQGDIVVFGATADHPYGHVAGYDGTQWVSDFKQGTDANPYKDQSSAGPESIFRALCRCASGSANGAGSTSGAP